MSAARLGNVGLRRAQWRSAARGSVAMQIWLGKQWLDQRDRPEPCHTSKLCKGWYSRQAPGVQ